MTDQEREPLGDDLPESSDIEGEAKEEEIKLPPSSERMVEKLTTEVDKETRMPWDKQKVLFARVKEGDEKARERLINEYLPLAAWVTRTFIRIPENASQIGREDLVSHAYIALVRAVDDYDMSIGARFSSYAVPCIFGRVHRAMLEEGRDIRIPIYVHEEYRKLSKIEGRLTQELGHKPEWGEVVTAAIKADRETFSFLEELTEEDRGKRRSRDLHRQPIRSLDEEVEFQDRGMEKPETTSYGSTLVNEREADDPERFLVIAVLRERIESILVGLNPIEREVLRLRFGLDDGYCRTLEETGWLLGNRTRDRIHQIERKALKKFRHPSRYRLLEEYSNL